MGATCRRSLRLNGHGRTPFPTLAIPRNEGVRGSSPRVGFGKRLGTWIGHISGRPDTEGAGPAGGIDGDEAGFIDIAAQAGQEAVGVRKVARPDEDRCQGDHATVDEFDTCQPVGLDHQPVSGTATIDDVTSAEL